MKKILVAYFSASGVTAKKAKKLAEKTGGDLFEIVPAVPYSEADLNWRDENSRSSVEMKNKETIRPEMKIADLDLSGYGTVFLGFPIWWYVAPTIINTFLEAYDFTGKKIILFATSGSSGFGNTASELEKSAPGAVIVEGALLNHDILDKKLDSVIKLSE